MVLSSFSSESMVFDRADLRVLRLAYDLVIEMSAGRRGLDMPQRSEIAKRVISTAWARNVRGLSLHGADVLIAREVVASLDQQVRLALCA